MKKMIFGLAVALALVGFASSAKAATVEELQSQIDALLSQLSGVSSSSSVGCYAFTRDLTVGSTGADVTALQNYLAAKGFFSVAATGYFGAITQASVSAWQSSNGVMPAAGYFGPISRAKYNATCSVGGGTSTGGGSTTVSGGESDLNNFEGSSASDSDVEEGDSAEVYEFEFDVDDADAEIERVDVMFKSTGADGDSEPWEVFEEITLMLDGEEVGSADGSDEDNWDEDADDEYRIRFNGVDTVVDEDSTPEFTVTVETQSNVDDVENDVSWSVWVPEEGVRALDGEGIDHTIGDDDTLAGATDDAEFDIEVEGQGEELSVSEGSENPDATVLELSDDETSDWLTVLVFTLEAEDNDIEVSELPVFVELSSSTIGAIVNDAKLIIDGEEYDDFTWSSTAGASATSTFEFDNGELVVADGEEIEVEFQLEFVALEAGNEGMTVQSSLRTHEVDAIEAEGAEDLDATQLTGSVTGDVHTLRTDGISLAAGDMSAEVDVIEGANNDQATYTVEFEVTAFGEDYYIPFGAATSTAQSDEGVSFDFLDGSNDAVTVLAASTTSSLDSTADEDDGAFVVREGDTETFTLTVVHVPGNASGTYKVLLQEVFFRLVDIADSAATGQAALPEADYRTGSVNILD